MNYPNEIQSLIDVAPGASLVPGSANLSVQSALESLTPDSFGQTVVDRSMAACCISGLWLKHNFDDRSHSLSQDIETAEGSYWHGIMHRRESDFSNSKYWYRRVGRHEIFAALLEAIQARPELSHIAQENEIIADGAFDPAAFVDAIQRTQQGRAQGQIGFLEEIAGLESDLLFDYCFQRAVGL